MISTISSTILSVLALFLVTSNKKSNNKHVLITFWVPTMFYIFACINLNQMR